jgi:teichuronic acid biosynthesis glycosyltransferase TuaG
VTVQAEIIDDMKTDVSVIIPTWNRAGDVEQAIRSALAQTAPVREILVCDDGSTDDTEVIVRNIGDPRIVWLPGPHAGCPAVPRNRGIERSKGEWIAFLDSDDTWLPDKINGQLHLARNLGCKAVSSNAQRLTARGEDSGDLLSFGEEKILFDDLIRVNYVVCSSAVIHRSLIAIVLGFPEDMKLLAVNDYALWLRVATLTDFAYTSQPMVTYKDDPEHSVRKKYLDVRGFDPSEENQGVLKDFCAWAKANNVSRSFRRRATSALSNSLANRAINKLRRAIHTEAFEL